MKLKRSSIFTKIVLAVLLVYALVMLVMIGDRSKPASEELEELRRQETALAADIDKMQYAIDNKDDPEVLEDIARSKLDMAYPDEEIFSIGRAD